MDGESEDRDCDEVICERMQSQRHGLCYDCNDDKD